MPYESPFTAIRAMELPTAAFLASSQSNDALSGTKALGQVYFDPTGIVGRKFIIFQATCWVSNALLTGNIHLYNITDGEMVTGTNFNFSNTAPGQQSSPPLTVGVLPGNIKPTGKVYEVRISVSGTLPTDVVSLGTANLLIG